MLLLFLFCCILEEYFRENYASITNTQVYATAPVRTACAESSAVVAHRRQPPIRHHHHHDHNKDRRIVVPMTAVLLDIIIVRSLANTGPGFQRVSWTLGSPTSARPACPYSSTRLLSQYHEHAARITHGPRIARTRASSLSHEAADAHPSQSRISGIA